MQTIWGGWGGGGGGWGGLSNVYGIWSPKQIGQTWPFHVSFLAIAINIVQLVLSVSQVQVDTCTQCVPIFSNWTCFCCCKSINYVSLLSYYCSRAVVVVAIAVVDMFL